MRHALIVDDEPDVLAWMSEVVKAEGYTVSTANSLRNARAQLVRQQPEILLTDLQLPDGHGMDLVGDLDVPMQTEVVVITGHASISSAIDAVRVGATDYLTKPVDMARLLSILRRQPHANDLKHEIGELRNELRRAGRFGQMLGSSNAMQIVFDKLAKVAPTSATVLLIGDTGTGKALAARTIHELGRRRRAPFVSLACAAAAPQAMDSELFGQDKGTGASGDRPHRSAFERAHGGTLFIDQIEHLPGELQQRLLRVLESGSFSKPGAHRPVATDIRLIASSNVDLEAMVAAGRFRSDLYRRLDAFTVAFPPLNARGGDVQMLAQHFLDRINRAEGTAKTFAPDVAGAIAAREWPGNVRELEAFVHRIYMLSDDLIHGASSSASLPSEHDGGVVTIRVGTSLDEVERRVTMATLERCGYVKRTAADVLGISLKTLYNRLEAYAARAAASRESDPAKPD